MQKVFLVLFFFLVISFCATNSEAQITSVDASYSGVTKFGDDYYVFCATSKDDAKGSLLAQSMGFGNAVFTWEKYDSIAKLFVPYTGAQQDDSLQSYINNLDDGCYRVTIDANGNIADPQQAWVLHDWIMVTKTEIPDSSSLCAGFKILAEFDFAPLIIYNTNTGDNSTVRIKTNPFYYEWYQGSTLVSTELNAYVSLPIASNTSVKYDLVITDKDFGCTGEGTVDYDSKVPESVFTADPMEGEAVLEVNFSNSSINYDSTYWFFYKDAYQISKEIEESNGEPVDSIDFILNEDAPFYEYKLSGEYFVKLVTVNENLTGNCYDTLKLESFINVLDTLVEVPNFFSPNGDNINDEFVVKTQSLKSMNIKIFNRWGGLVHSWKYSNITSSYYTYEHSVWDGRIGSRMASPGVYYYVIQYEGRQVDYDRKRERNVKGTKKGFIHLFRSKI